MQRRVPDPNILPAVNIIRAAAEVGPRAKGPELLIHSWSNGGSAMLAHLRIAFNNKLPPHVTIFDSGPALYSHAAAVASNTVGVTMPLKLVVYPIASLISVVYFIFYAGRTDPIRRWSDTHNAVEGEARRTYIYSNADKLVDDAMVEEHARIAREKGYDVRLERFEGTEHVAHIRGDEDRYWRIVKETSKL
jgi:hypothetical protein